MDWLGRLMNNPRFYFVPGVEREQNLSRSECVSNFFLGFLKHYKDIKNYAYVDGKNS